jgi:hypothetical protein
MQALQRAEVLGGRGGGGSRRRRPRRSGGGGGRDKRVQAGPKGGTVAKVGGAINQKMGRGLINGRRAAWASHTGGRERGRRKSAP